MSLEDVKTFYERLAKDENFRTQIQGVKNQNECSQIVKDAGYDFTTEEYEEFIIQLLESTATDDEIKDLDEKELAIVFGGIGLLPMYGLPRLPKWPKPIQPQPMYGIVTLE